MEIENVHDYLEHFGKKGMKWGVRKASSGGAKPLSKSKARDQAIREARAKQFTKEIDVYKSAAKTVFGTKGKTRGESASETIDKAVDLVKGDNRKMAMKFTRGEKVATGLLLGVIGAVNVAAIAQG
jgi:hypothetical protein